MTKIESLKRGFRGELLFEEFEELTGLIFGEEEVKSLLEEWEEELKEVDLYDEIDEETGYIDANRTTSEKIMNFLKLTKDTFHIITQCYEGETEYWENRMAYVNRVSYLLAIGNENPEVFFSEEYHRENEK